MKAVLETILNYPRGASFYFQGYKGVDDYEILKGYLIDKLLSLYGTQLILGIADRSNTQK